MPLSVLILFVHKYIMSIRENLSALYNIIPPNVKVVAVSKMMPPGVIMQAYEAGQRLFGENKSQELISKQPLLPDDIRWHYIGHLQSNKVRYIAPFIDMIESVDSLKLLKEINKEALKNSRVIKCLLQFHIASEETKYGLDLEEAEVLLSSQEYADMKNIMICGVMGMASFTDDSDLVRREFHGLKAVESQLKNKYFADKPWFCEISMGMTGDYRIAIEEGSTIVRIGTGIFGKF
jgi:pyridoxal phosphate enzyme (YggS family)